MEKGNQMRLIDTDALMNAMYHRAFETDGDTMWQSGCWVRYKAIEQVVKEQPSVEAEPVRHGHWIYTPTNLLGYVCSECGNGMCRFNYCPHCGALMDKET